MAKNINKDVAYKAAKSKEKDYMINDGEGLYFFVGKNGARLWRFVYTFNKKQKKLALGVYPGVTLEAARRKAEEASENIANGIDPSEIRKQGKQNTQIDTENAKRKADGLPILNPSLTTNFKTSLISID